MMQSAATDPFNDVSPDVIDRVLRDVDDVIGSDMRDRHAARSKVQQIIDERVTQSS